MTRCFSTPALLLIAANSGSLRRKVMVAAQGADDSTSTACNVCATGEPMGLPDREVPVPGFGLNSCAYIQEQLTTFGLTQGSDFCNVVQSLGTMCGCSIPSAETNCRLCYDGSEVVFPNRLLGGLFLNEFFPFLPASDELMSCEMLQAFLYSKEKNSKVCLRIQQEFSELCACPEPPEDANVLDNVPNGNSNIEAEKGLASPAETESPSNSGRCTLCPNGEAVGHPNKTLGISEFPADSCADLEILASSVEPNSLGCMGAQGMATYCGCPVPSDVCHVCPDGKPVKYPDKKLDWFTEDFQFVDLPDYLLVLAKSLTCGLMESIAHSLSDEKSVAGVDIIAACTGVQMRASICGCDPYWKDKLLFWSHRVAGMLSFLGSFLILHDVLSEQKKRSSTYHQLMLGISSFDMISSLAYVLSGFVLPASSGYYSAAGNEATCKLQGFMIQLGLTSVFYNIFLSIYYFLVIRYNWKEFRFLKYRRYVHGCLIVLGLAMSFGGIPFYGHSMVTCQVLVPPFTKSKIPNLFFLILPLVLALFILTTTMTIICWTVYSQEKRALKWMARKNLSMTKQVFWQSFFYVVIFYVSVTFVIITSYVDYKEEFHFWIYWLNGVFSPAQGFFNAFVYAYRSKGRRLFACGRLCRGLFSFVREQDDQGKVHQIAEPTQATVSGTMNDSSTRRVAQAGLGSLASGRDSSSNSDSSPERKKPLGVGNDASPDTKIKTDVAAQGSSSEWGTEEETGKETYLVDAEAGDEPVDITSPGNNDGGEEDSIDIPGSELNGIGCWGNGGDDDGSVEIPLSAAAELWSATQGRLNLPFDRVLSSRRNIFGNTNRGQQSL